LRGTVLRGQRPRAPPRCGLSAPSTPGMEARDRRARHLKNTVHESVIHSLAPSEHALATCLWMKVPRPASYPKPVPRRIRHPLPAHRSTACIIPKTHAKKNQGSTPPHGRWGLGWCPRRSPLACYRRLPSRRRVPRCTRSIPSDICAHTVATVVG